MLLRRLLVVLVLERVMDLARSGIAIVLSAHDPDHALLCADRVAMLHEGRLLRLGDPDDAITSETLKLVYGVDVSIVRPPGSDRLICVPSLSGQDRRERLAV